MGYGAHGFPGQKLLSAPWPIPFQRPDRHQRGENQYEPFRNNPIRYRDAFGLCPDDVAQWEYVGSVHDTSWSDLNTAHDLYLFSLAGGNVNGNPVLSYNQAQNLAYVSDGTLLVGSQALSTYWMMSSLLTMPARASTVTVTRWQSPPSDALRSGNWVVRGGRTRWNWAMSGKMNPLRPRYHVPFEHGRSFTVPRSFLRDPTGIEKLKSLSPWRQSRFYP